MSLDNDFLDLEKQKQRSIFGLISTAIVIVWLGVLLLPFFLGFYRAGRSFVPTMALQLVGLAFAIISIRKNETRRILYLIGLILNGVGFLYFFINQVF